MTEKPSIADPADGPREPLLALMAIAMANLLIHDFEEIMLERVDHASDQICPLGQSAEAAHCIVELCRRLLDQIQRFERFDRMCRVAEADRMGREGDVIPS